MKFACSNPECLVMDNTATAGIPLGTPNPLCTICQTGEWHGEFPAEKWEYSVHGPLTSAGRYVDPPGYWGVLELIPSLDIHPVTEGGPEQERKAA